jgi:hypothetical protein
VTGAGLSERQKNQTPEPSGKLGGFERLKQWCLNDSDFIQIAESVHEVLVMVW